ncbi:MAG: septum formation initiator family protein [Ignavibacteriales bacterium]|nr:septum formation initiator family protein [Ignavibacteriales bacterium]
MLALAGLLARGTVRRSGGLLLDGARSRRPSRCSSRARRAPGGERAPRLRDSRRCARDPRSIERLAREQLGLARPDETVFLIREDACRPLEERLAKTLEGSMARNAASPLTARADVALTMGRASVSISDAPCSKRFDP